MLINFIFCPFLILSETFKKIRKNILLFCRNIVEYTCKSNEVILQEIYLIQLIIFPLII